jgi:hypothetical protein
MLTLFQLLMEFSNKFNDKTIKKITMKKNLISISILGLFAIATFAQGPVEVAPNSPRTFTVNLTNNVTLKSATPYTWSVSGSGVVAPIPTSNTNSITVNFGASGTSATISVYATAATNCSSDLHTMNLTVKPLTYTATLPQASQDICPVANNALLSPAQTGIAAPITVNFNTAVTGFSYTINGVLQTPVTVASSATGTINIATPFTAAQAGAVKVEIVSITGAAGTSLQPNGAVVYTINVSAAPTISDIF